MMSKADTSLNVLVFRKDDVWVARCLEYKLSVDSKNREDLIEKFRALLRNQMRLAKLYDCKPLEGLERSVQADKAIGREIAFRGFDDARSVAAI